jgi:tetratricopeptide (TPR) repeat protein
MDAFMEVVKEFIVWAKTKGRWPLLLLVLAIPALFSIRWWKGLELREAILDDDVWLVVAVIMLLSGALLIFTLKSAGNLRWLTSLVLLIPSILLGGFAVAPPPAPPEGTIVIAVAQFTPVDPDDRRDARIITRKIVRRLEEEAVKHDPKWVVRELSRQVQGENTDAARAAALEIARARHVNAHLIVWGEVLKDGGSMEIGANTAIARMPSRSSSELRPEQITSAEPTSFASKQEAVDGVVSGVVGLMHFARGEYEKAVPNFTQSGTNEERMARGLALYQQSLLQQESREILIKAIAAYDSILQAGGAAQSEETLWSARINKAAALVALARGSAMTLASQQREAAIGLYRFALNSRGRTAWKDDWPKLQHGLGIALSDHGESVEGDSAITLLRGAVVAYDSALAAYSDGKHVQEYAAILNTKAAALTELGRLIESEEGDRMLHEAIGTYRLVLALSSSNWRRAGTQTNMGAALTDLGRRARGDVARASFQQAIAAHREALVVTDSVSREQRAITTENLAAALSALAELTSGEERHQLLKDALRQFQAAQAIWAAMDRQDPQTELADSVQAISRKLGLDI